MKDRILIGCLFIVCALAFLSQQMEINEIKSKASFWRDCVLKLQSQVLILAEQGRAASLLDSNFNTMFERQNTLWHRHLKDHPPQISVWYTNASPWLIRSDVFVTNQVVTNYPSK